MKNINQKYLLIEDSLDLFEKDEPIIEVDVRSWYDNKFLENSFTAKITENVANFIKKYDLVDTFIEIIKHEKKYGKESKNIENQEQLSDSYESRLRELQLVKISTKKSIKNIKHEPGNLNFRENTSKIR